MAKVILLALGVGLASAGANAAECPDGTVLLTGTTFVCIARDKNGKCTLVDVRENRRCVPRK
jgi:hypothetical protein